jgi:hypothetical protein
MTRTHNNLKKFIFTSLDIDSIILLRFPAFPLNFLDGFVDWTKEVTAEFDTFETADFRFWRDLNREVFLEAF